MPRNPKAKSTASQWSPAQMARLALGLLIAVNLGAAWMVLYPPGGSAETLEQDMARLQQQVRQSQTRLQETRAHAGSVEKGRAAADDFLERYFVTRRTLPSTLLDQLNQIGVRAGIKDRGNQFGVDLIEGSEALGMVTITANFEGTYRNLMNFVREIDRSESLLIIESLNAVPQQGTGNLIVSVKMEAFIRDAADAPLRAEMRASR